MSDTIHMDLEHGQVVIELRPDLAPNHVARIKELTGAGFYDGVVFHRVIPGFMAQTGDPTGTGTGGSEKPNVAAEFSEESHVRGTLLMARSAASDSANSQFFICFGDCPWLNGQYSVFGKVVSGMEHVDAIKKGAEGGNGEVGDPDSIKKMSLAE